MVRRRTNISTKDNHHDRKLPQDFARIRSAHRHVKNEEVYGVLEGRGELFIDGEVFELKAGDWFRISPEGRRAIRAAADQGIRFVCIQTKAGSLEGFTNDDGVACDEKAPWF